MLGKYTGPAVPDAFGSWTRMKVLFFRGGYKSPLGVRLPADVGAASEEDRSVVPLCSTPAFGRAEPTLTDGEAVGEDGAPGCSVLVWVVGEKERPGVSRAFACLLFSSLVVGAN